MASGVAYDVVVVGFGGSGAVAALAASDEGASVAIVEKGGDGGGNTREAGGSLRQIADVESATDYLIRLSQGGTPTDMIESFVRETNPAIDWLRKLGLLLTSADGPWSDWKYPAVTHDPFPGVPGNNGLGDRVRVLPESESHGGSALWPALQTAVAQRDIDVFLDTRVLALSRSGTGRVNGVEAVGPDGPLPLVADRGVVLACGGFGANKAMQRDYLGMVVPAFGNPDGNTGDGVRLALSVGADLWHMNAVAAVLGYRIDGFTSAFRHHMYRESFIYVDQYAHRFVDEMGLDNHALPWAFRYMDPYLPGFPRIPAYLVFDEAARLAGPIVKDNLGYHRRDWSWSTDNSVEIQRGWIARAETAGELAELLGLAPAALQKTVAEYNASALAGEDRAFGRRSDSLVDLDGPLYGIALWPCLLNTQGGPRRDTTGAVLAGTGNRIAGLFAAGELGSMWTELYPGGGNLIECIVSGIAAGKSASQADR